MGRVWQVRRAHTNSFGKQLWCWACKKKVQSKVDVSSGYQDHRCPDCGKILAHYTIDGE